MENKTRSEKEIGEELFESQAEGQLLFTYSEEGDYFEIYDRGFSLAIHGDVIAKMIETRAQSQVKKEKPLVPCICANERGAKSCNSRNCIFKNK